MSELRLVTCYQMTYGEIWLIDPHAVMHPRERRIVHNICRNCKEIRVLVESFNYVCNRIVLEVQLRIQLEQIP